MNTRLKNKNCMKSTPEMPINQANILTTVIAARAVKKNNVCASCFMICLKKTLYPQIHPTAQSAPLTTESNSIDVIKSPHVELMF